MSDQTQQQESPASTKLGAPSTSKRVSFFDADSLPERPITREGDDPASALIHLKALLNQTDDDGYSLLWFRLAPNLNIPRHSHNIGQTILVLDGELRQGNRVLGPGSGYFIPAESVYTVKAGPQGVTLVEFRHCSASDFTTDYTDGIRPLDPENLVDME